MAARREPRLTTSSGAQSFEVNCRASVILGGGNGSEAPELAGGAREAESEYQVNAWRVQ
jgi:hypothetical protein